MREQGQRRLQARKEWPRIDLKSTLTASTCVRLYNISKMHAFLNILFVPPTTISTFQPPMLICGSKVVAVVIICTVPPTVVHAPS